MNRCKCGEKQQANEQREEKGYREMCDLALARYHQMRTSGPRQHQDRQPRRPDC